MPALYHLINIFHSTHLFCLLMYSAYWLMMRFTKIFFNSNAYYNIYLYKLVVNHTYFHVHSSLTLIEITHH